MPASQGGDEEISFPLPWWTNSGLVDQCFLSPSRVADVVVLSFLPDASRLGALERTTWGICNNNNNDPYAKSGQTLQGSFSAVSKPNFASKYSCESSRRDLHNSHLWTALRLHFFV